MTTETGMVVSQPSDMGLSLVVTAQEARARLKQLQDFVKEAMVPDVDFGVIPGTGSKPTLLKPGAEKLLEIYGLASTLTVTNRIENWDGNGFFHYEISCVLTIKGTDIVVATGIGSCNSKESRYRWREGGRKCPECGSGAIIKGKEQFGGGWVCFKKKGGCGANFRDDDPNITRQQQGRVENDDVFSQVNTILKMAGKRAKIDATLSATRSSALFTQDVEDFADRGGGDDFDDDGPLPPRGRQQPQPAQRQPQGRSAQQRPTMGQGRVIDVTPEQAPPSATAAEIQQEAMLLELADDNLDSLMTRFGVNRGNVDALIASTGGPSWGTLNSVRRAAALGWLERQFAAQQAEAVAADQAV